MCNHDTHPFAHSPSTICFAPTRTLHLYLCTWTNVSNLLKMFQDQRTCTNDLGITLQPQTHSRASTATVSHTSCLLACLSSDPTTPLFAAEAVANEGLSYDEHVTAFAAQGLFHNSQSNRDTRAHPSHTHTHVTFRCVDDIRMPQTPVPR